jgi:phosphohistidine phosphatase SixA
MACSVVHGVSAAMIVLLAAVSSSAQAADDPWALLKKPGHIVLLRHSNAPGSMPESNDMDMKNCKIQRNLDADGRAQAVRIGNEFRKHKISSVKLVSSEYCRALDTAKLMKLGPVTPLRALNQVFLADVPGMREAGVSGREYMKKIPAKQLTVLVTHVTNIQSIAGAKLDSGEMAVVHFDPAGEVVVDGKITVP